MDYRKVLGNKGEELAAAEYVRLGFLIIGRNIRMHAGRQVGELDVIAVKDREVVFVEVKTRSGERFGHPSEAVGPGNRRRLVRACQLFLLHHPAYRGWNWRIDVVEVRIDKKENPVIIIPNAIEDY